MKLLKDYSDKEKIELFDKIHNSALEEWKEAKRLEDAGDDYDSQYFWEGIMETVLGEDIWDDLL